MNLYATDNHPLREITNIINIPTSTIYAINKRGTDINKPRSERPKKLSPRHIQQIIRYIRTNKSTRRVTLTRLKKIFQLNVHENIIRNALQLADYHHRVARRRSYLNKRDKKRRLKFAKEHKDWMVKDWAKVLFSDEMAIKLFMKRHTRDYV